jgi:hypothetical protein
MTATTEKVVAGAGKARALQCIRKHRTRPYEFAIKNDTKINATMSGHHCYRDLGNLDTRRKYCLLLGCDAV